MSDEPVHPFLEVRHVQDLTQAIRALTTVITRYETARQGDDRLRRVHEARQSAALEQIAKHTENLPALLDLLVTKRTNGHGHHEELSDARPDPDR